MNKLKIKVDRKMYLILFSDVILHVYELVGDTGAGKLVFNSDKTIIK